MSDESDEDSDDNFVGRGGKWEFIGEATKKNGRRKYFDVRFHQSSYL